MTSRDTEKGDDNMKVLLRILFLLLFSCEISFSTFSEKDLRSRFSFNTKSKDFSFFSGQIKTYLFTDNMHSYNSVKCTMKGKRRIPNNKGIPITEFSVANCTTVGLSGSKRINISKVYLLGAGIDHRFSGAKNGGHILIPRMAYFYDRYTDGFVY